jgi:hypothetical protein
MIGQERCQWSECREERPQHRALIESTSNAELVTSDCLLSPSERSVAIDRLERADANSGRRTERRSGIRAELVELAASKPTPMPEGANAA